MPVGGPEIKNGGRDWSGEHIHFVTGRLAEYSLRQVVEPLAADLKFQYTIDVLKITVAALMTTEWVSRRLSTPAEATRVIVPGYCQGDLAILEATAGCPVERGPRDLRRLAAFFREGGSSATDYGGYDIELLAEINHAPGMPLSEVIQEAAGLAAAGADMIDLGCTPGETWQGVGAAVRALKDEGHRVSIDSMNITEIAAATAAGAELVLSVNQTNCRAALDWGVEVVVIPDDPQTLAGLDKTIEILSGAGVPLRVDPVLSPIGFGFTCSLGHYIEVRRRYPDAEMMMGIGNLTELTDVDSAGINVLLLAICEELSIQSVLTTQVINWAKTSVAECDLARRLVYHAVHQETLPKHLEQRLVMLRDILVPEYGDEFFQRLQNDLKDNNIRLFVDGGRLHLITAKIHLEGSDPFALFQEFLDQDQGKMDRGHAFYVGYEMCKAVTASALGKNYQQDEALDWGLLTVSEESHWRVRDRERKK
jgi:dihydropteroate synthase